MDNEFGTEKKSKTALKLVALLVVVIIIVAGVVYWIKFRKVENGIVINPPAITTVATDEMPDHIPTDLPIEEGVQILQNFETKKEGTDQFQSTRQYVSKKSFNDNVVAYSTYFIENKEWNTSSSIIGDKSVTFLAGRGIEGEEMTISIGVAAGNQSMVNISVVYTK